MMYSASLNGPCSLSMASNEVSECFGISISKQGLDERYNSKAVDFIKGVFEQQLRNQIDGTLHPGFLEKFGRVKIKDSTRFDLPEKLKDYYRGFGGRITSEAATSIQFELDIKKGEMLDVQFTSARRTDYQDARETIEDVHKQDLIIRDLGYFKLEVLKKIAGNEAFFISRLNTQTLVYDQDDNNIPFISLYKKMQKQKISHVEMQVKIGEKEKLPVRLIVDIVPEAVYQKRIVKAKKEAKRNGHQVSQEFKARAHFNLMVTNVLEEDLPSPRVYQLYKIRWQIELTFKTWKSTIGIEKVHPMGYYRIMCFFYAKLLLILVSQQIINLLQPFLYKQYGNLLSKDKCFKTLRNYFYKIRKILFRNRPKTEKFIKKMATMFSKNHWLEKKKNKLNYKEIFDLFCSISDN